VALLFLKLGTISFGGPAAHAGLMREEVVRRRRWVTDEQFLDLLGIANLIPGPNSTEMAIYLGFLRAGWPGLVLGGACFILPAAVIVAALGWLYVTYGALPAATWLLYGIKPVIIAVVVQAMWALGRAAVKGPGPALLGAAILGLYFAGGNEIALLFAGGAIGLLARGPGGGARAVVPAALAAVAGPAAAAPTGAAATGGVLATLFLTFLKIGAILYGSGYVLLAFLRRDFVEGLGWLTDRQLLDAVAVGQFTPGPVLTTATFVGYVAAGWTGAALATVAIFLPSFVFVAAMRPILPRLRASRWSAGFLDGVNVAALALMAAVTWQLGRAAIVDAITAALAATAAVLLLRRRVNSAWLVLGGAAVGLARYLAAG
jgi:chromate transporter